MITMKTTTARTALAAACAAALAAAAPALADASFGTAFFVSMDRAADGEVRIDWIGSAMIWALIAMSVASVALIWIAFASNRADDILPPEEAAALRRTVAEGRFGEALDASRSGGGDFGRMLHAALGLVPARRAGAAKP